MTYIDELHRLRIEGEMEYPMADDGQGYDQMEQDDPENACVDCGERDASCSCDCCGGPLCHQCAECGANFCKECLNDPNFPARMDAIYENLSHTRPM